MSNAYIVCGPVSSGNRLLASILVRSGCRGEGSTNQPLDPSYIPSPTGPLVIIVHRELRLWIHSLRAKGYSTITAIVIVREPISTARSAVAHNHMPDFEAAANNRLAAIAGNIVDALASRVYLEIVTYEGLTEEFLQDWLPRIGLPYVSGPLSLPGQRAPTSIENQNAKHY